MLVTDALDKFLEWCGDHSAAAPNAAVTLFGGEMNIASAVTTAPRATSYLDDTLHSLAEAGFADPLIFADGKAAAGGPQREAWSSSAGRQQGPAASTGAGRVGPYRNWKRALSTLIECHPRAEAYAVFQDDIVLAYGLRSWLERQLWPAEVETIGVVSLYTAGPHDRPFDGWHTLERHAAGCGTPPSGLADSAADRKRTAAAYGALAYVLPPASARRFLERDPRPENRTQIDNVVGEYCRRSGLGYWMHSPSPVQHVGAVSTLSAFGLTRHRTARRFARDAAALPHSRSVQVEDVCKLSIGPDGSPLDTLRCDRSRHLK